MSRPHISKHQSGYELPVSSVQDEHEYAYPQFKGKYDNIKPAESTPSRSGKGRPHGGPDGGRHRGPHGARHGGTYEAPHGAQYISFKKFILTVILTAMITLAGGFACGFATQKYALGTCKYCQEFSSLHLPYRGGSHKTIESSTVKLI